MIYDHDTQKPITLKPRLNTKVIKPQITPTKNNGNTDLIMALICLVIVALVTAYV